MSSVSECQFLFWSVCFAFCQFTQYDFDTQGCQLVENTAYCSHGSQQTIGPAITDSTQHKSIGIQLKSSVTRAILKCGWTKLINLQFKASCFPLLIVLCCVSSIWQPAWASSLRRSRREKQLSPIYWIWPAVPILTAVNITYRTF